MNAYWLSWYYYDEDGPFEIHSPWWISGYAYRGDDMASIIVAAVKAGSEDEAWDFVQESYDSVPEDIDRRFCEELDRSPFSERFPRADWMKWEE